MPILLDLPFILIYAFGPAFVFISFLILIRLRSVHPERWKELGEPWFWVRRAKTKHGGYADFIYRGGYQALNDTWFRLLVPALVFSSWTTGLSLLVAFLLDVLEIRNANEVLSWWNR